MSEYFELQGSSSDLAFKSCENLLLMDSVLNEAGIYNCLTDYDVSEETCQDISMCHDLNCTDHSIHELVDVLSNSNSPNQKTDFLELSLDDIPLTETNPTTYLSDFVPTNDLSDIVYQNDLSDIVYQNDLSDIVYQNDLSGIIPQNIPDNKLLLLQVPENLQDSCLLNDVMNIDLDQSIVDEIEKAMKGSGGIFLTKPAEEPIEIIRRPPLQLIQQVIKFPVVKNARISKAAADLKAANKRKQHFQFPREDGVEFYSDDDDDDDENDENIENSQKQPITVIDDGPSSPKKAKLEEVIIEPPIIVNKSTEIPHESPKKEKKKSPRFVIQNCPRCDKSFKKLSMHKCRDPVKDNGPIKKLIPSEVPLPLKCESCKAFFTNQEVLDKHQVDKHSHLTCKICKKVMKNAQGLKIHSAKCGIDIQPVKKLTQRNDKNQK